MQFMARIVTLILIGLFLGSVPVARADVQHTVRFGEGALVVVWTPGAETAAFRGRDVVLAGTGFRLAPSAYGPDPVVTGTLIPVSSAVAVSETMVRRRILVASNAPFTIALVGREPSGQVRSVPAEFSVVSTGPNAQVSGTTDGSAFRATQRTARSRGSVVSQAVEFEVAWSGSPDLDVEIVVRAGVEP